MFHGFDRTPFLLVQMNVLVTLFLFFMGLYRSSETVLYADVMIYDLQALFTHGTVKEKFHSRNSSDNKIRGHLPKSAAEKIMSQNPKAWPTRAIMWLTTVIAVFLSFGFTELL